MLPLDRYREYLQAQGKRFTREKQLIVEQVVRFRRAFTTEELIDEFSEQLVGTRVSRSTVYRVIAELASAKVICQFIPDDASLWIVNLMGE